MWLETPVIQIMQDNPVSIDVNEPFSAAYRILSADRFHHLPVLEHRKLVGMLSTQDVLKLSYSLMQDEDGVDPALLDRLFQIRAVMTQDPTAISDRATLGEAAKSLSAGGFHALPVVDQDHRLRGIVTSTDLINHMLEHEPITQQGADGGRLKVLEDVCQAAQRYLHSGLAETEHSRLERALQAVRRLKS